MIYTYVCPNGHEIDRRGGVADVTLPCACGCIGTRKPFNRIAIKGETVAKAPYSVSEFVEASAEVDYHYTKAENDGMPVKRPDLWGQAKKKAGIGT